MSFTCVPPRFAPAGRDGRSGRASHPCVHSDPRRRRSWVGDKGPATFVASRDRATPPRARMIPAAYSCRGAARAQRRGSVTPGAGGLSDRAGAGVAEARGLAAACVGGGAHGAAVAARERSGVVGAHGGERGGDLEVGVLVSSGTYGFAPRQTARLDRTVAPQFSQVTLERPYRNVSNASRVAAMTLLMCSPTSRPACDVHAARTSRWSLYVSPVWGTTGLRQSWGDLALDARAAASVIASSPETGSPRLVQVNSTTHRSLSR